MTSFFVRHWRSHNLVWCDEDTGIKPVILRRVDAEGPVSQVADGSIALCRLRMTSFFVRRGAATTSFGAARMRGIKSVILRRVDAEGPVSQVADGSFAA